MLKDFILNEGIKRFVVLKDWIDGIVNGRLEYHSAAGSRENGMNDGLGLVFDDE